MNCQYRSTIVLLFNVFKQKGVNKEGKSYYTRFFVSFGYLPLS